VLPFKKCPVCGGDMTEKEVEKLLRGGENVAVLKVKAEVWKRRISSPWGSRFRWFDKVTMRKSQ